MNRGLVLFLSSHPKVGTKPTWQISLPPKKKQPQEHGGCTKASWGLFLFVCLFLVFFFGCSLRNLSLVRS